MVCVRLTQELADLGAVRLRQLIHPQKDFHIVSQPAVCIGQICPVRFRLPIRLILQLLKDPIARIFSQEMIEALAKIRLF